MTFGWRKLYLIFLLVPFNKANTLKGKFIPIGPGTDEGLYNEGFLEGDIDPVVDMKNAVADPELLWPSGAVIFKTEDGVGCPESPQCEILMKAMEHYHQHSCIRFKEWTGEKDYISIFFNPDSGACWSTVGRTGGRQRLSLGHRCWYLGIVIHELGHSIGFWHEMNRPDRDQWIYIYWKNIIPGFVSAFSKHDSKSVNTLGENFDYKSIMMYDEYAFSKDGISPTLQAKMRGLVIGPIWKKPGLSSSDIRRLHKLYKCSGSDPLPSFPYNELCDFKKDTCGFKNGGAAVWNWKTTNNTEGFVYASYKTAGTTPGYLISINFHGLSKNDRRGPMGCVRFWFMLEGSDCNMQLKLTQAYLNNPTQLFYDRENLHDLWENDTVTDQWMQVEVSLYVTRPFKLIFLSNFNKTCSFGTIGLDDIELLYTPCETSTTQRQDHATFDTITRVTDVNKTTGCALRNTTKYPPGSNTESPVTTQYPTKSNTIFPTDFMDLNNVTDNNGMF